MDNSLLVNLDHHRSRERIKDFGEVFTPEQYVKQMLSLLDPKIWADENVIFFEPSAGHGNIVLPIISKRIEALSKKYKRNYDPDVYLRAVAVAMNTLWAVDICPVNVEHSRKRVFEFLVQVLRANGSNSLRSTKSREYLTHLICSISWQIRENEALSALSNRDFAQSSASKTKLGQDWSRKNGHVQINFENDWISHFRDCTKNKSVPIVFERARKFVDLMFMNGAVHGLAEFEFAKHAIEGIIGAPNKRMSGVA